MRRVLLLPFVLVTASTFAQNALPPEAAVDQAVGDLGPSAVSFRRIDPGNAQFSPRVRMFERRPDDRGWSGVGLPALDQMYDRNRYVYRAPGVTALIDQPSYLVRSSRPSGRPRYEVDVAPDRDGQAIPLISAGTVFSLIPEDAAPPPVPEADPWADVPGGDPRLDLRLDGRLDGDYDQTFDAEPMVAPAPR